MPESQPPNEDSPSVQTHLTMMQGVINRMAENSRSCKVWCVTLVAAVLVLVAQTGEPQHALLALGPTLLFGILDSYYLALEALVHQNSERLRQEAPPGRTGVQRRLPGSPDRDGLTPSGAMSWLCLDMAVLPLGGGHGGSRLATDTPICHTS